MPTRYAESYGDTVYVVAEYKDAYGETHGLYITETYGKIIIAHNVVYTDDGNIKYWGNGEYGAMRGHNCYKPTEDWLVAFENTMARFITDMKGA